MSQPLLIDQHTGSATYIETMRDDHFFVIRWGRLRTIARLSAIVNTLPRRMRRLRAHHSRLPPSAARKLCSYRPYNDETMLLEKKYLFAEYIEEAAEISRKSGGDSGQGLALACLFEISGIFSPMAPMKFLDSQAFCWGPFWADMWPVHSDLWGRTGCSLFWV